MRRALRNALFAFAMAMVVVSSAAGRTCEKFWCRTRPEVRREIEIERALGRLGSGEASSTEVSLFRESFQSLLRGRLFASAETRARLVFLALELGYFPLDERGASEAYLLLGGLLGELRESGVRSLAHFERARLRARVGGDPRPDLESAAAECVSEELRERILLSAAVVSFASGDSVDELPLAELVERSRYRTTRALAAVLLALGVADVSFADAERWLRTGTAEWSARSAVSQRPPWSDFAIRESEAELLALVFGLVEGTRSCADVFAKPPAREAQLLRLFSCEESRRKPAQRG